MKRIPMPIILAFVVLSPSIARAHEPLWGESASTVGDRVWHPDLKFAFMPSHRLRSGSGSAANPTGLSMSRMDQTTSVDYGVGPRLNLRFEIPVHNLSMRETMNGVNVRSRFTELGDVMVAAKYRFYIKSGPGTKSQQSAFFGVRMPTGSTSVRDSTGAPIAAEDQPGSGTWAARLGYILTRETRKNSIWASGFLDESLRRRRFSPGTNLEFDASYGHWLKFPESIPDLGTMVTGGVHAQWQDSNRLAGGRDPNSGQSMVGLHTTFIAQKDQNQLRFGVLIPVWRHVRGVQPAERFEIRFGVERFF